MEIKEIIAAAIEKHTLRKIVFSRPRDNDIMKTTASLYSTGGEIRLQLETLTRDNKAVHKNFTLDEGIRLCAETAEKDYRQTDIITTAGQCTVMISKSGASHIKNGIKESGAAEIIRPHDEEKTHILDEPSALPFLRFLGICGDDGRVFDKKRAKYRQINRFLEILGDAYGELPREGELTVCDLCCGKAYLTFAVYWYLTAVKGREVKIFGVDLKADMMTLCQNGAALIGCSGMSFICGDALNFTPPSPPDLVISLHACDIATDIVLAGAVGNGARVILSTPCCHHELFGKMDSDALGFIARYPILKQKLCDAATDSLRALRLEIAGYDVTAVELIDPDETPKNVLLRAVKRRRPLTEAQSVRLKAEYEAAVKLLGADLSAF